MTLPAPRRGRSFLIVNTAVALLAGALAVQAQQPPPGSSPPASGATAAPTAPKSKSAKSGAAATAVGANSAASYGMGVSMGEQLRAGGVSPADINSERLLQGVRDGLAGKAKLTDADRKSINDLLRSSYEAQGDKNHRAAAAFLAENAKKPNVVTTASGLQYKVLNAGSGDAPKASDSVTVNYKGTLLDGTVFDSSYTRGEPATFQVNRVIPGWTEALQLMKPGAKYQLFIPPQLAYDLKSRPPIPPGSLLLFDVELLSVKPAAAAGAEAPAAPASTPAQPTPPPTPK
jgi:FKBP-type peptidyl-prolyl cis-trans isomerase